MKGENTDDLCRTLDLPADAGLHRTMQHDRVLALQSVPATNLTFRPLEPDLDGLVIIVRDFRPLRMPIRWVQIGMYGKSAQDNLAKTPLKDRGRNRREWFCLKVSETGKLNLHLLASKLH